MAQTFIELLEERIKSHWELPAFSNYGMDPLTYGDVADKIVWLHYIFRQNHIKSGLNVKNKAQPNWQKKSAQLPYCGS